jgi:hypothetical protein
MTTEKAAEKVTPSNMKAIKDFFVLTAKDAMAEAKTLTAEDKQQLGDGIRSGTLSY